MQYQSKIIIHSQHASCKFTGHWCYVRIPSNQMDRQCEPPNSDAYILSQGKYAHGFVVLCFVVVMQSFIMNSHEVFIHIHQGCFAGTGAIVRLPQRQWSTPDGYGKISQCITTTKHSKAKTVCTFLGIYCSLPFPNIDIQMAVIDVIACTSICEQHVCMYCTPWSVIGFIIDWIVQAIN